uniref:Exocyst complex component Sec10 n=1 Tax=Panagrellus redivivus TaxID=6233 RepID=A0A7E4VMX7_PANRE
MAGQLDDPSILYPPESAMPATEQAVAEVFDDIDVVYFMEDGFDATGYELGRMGDKELDVQDLSKEMFKLKRQLQVVSKKISVLIAQNAEKFSSQTKHYERIQAEAGGMVEEIAAVRENLAKAHAEVMNGLRIVANERKREMLAELKEVLTSIKTLYETEFRLQELVQEGDFPMAIRLCVEATNAAQEFIAFDCIKGVSKKFTKILSSMESHIDDALATMTVAYDLDKYTLVYSAYQMLDNVQSAASKLSSFFRATLESSARTVLIDRLRKTHTAEQTDAMAYEQLCEAVDMDDIIDTIRELGFVLCRCLFVYHEILKFHIEEDERRLCSMPIAETSDLDAAPIIEKGIMQKALSTGLYSVFKTASAKFNTLLCCHDLSQLKFDNFLDVVEMANRFRKFGRRYFGNSCAEVAMTVEKQTCMYFKQYHRERMDELRLFLENEVFAPCPVPASFTLFDLQEFQFLKESSDAFDEDDNHPHHYLVDHASLGEQLDYILLTPDTDNPFCAPQTRESVSSVKTVNNDVSPDGMSRGSSETSVSSVLEVSQNDTPNLCNTAFNVLRFFGRYIRMTSLLHSIAEEAITAIIQLFEYFGYSIFCFFAKDLVAEHIDANVFTSLQLRKLVEAIRVRLILETDGGENAEHMRSDKFPTCQLSHCLDINSSETCYLVGERVIGIESLIFLKKQFESLRPVLQSLVPNNRQLPILEKFYKDTLPVIPDIRKAAFGCVSSRVLDYTKVLKLINGVNFNLNEIHDQSSTYVTYLIDELRTLKAQLTKISEDTPITKEIDNLLWSNTIYCITRVLVQGYSDANKKCTQEGRALMLLDFEQLVRQLEMLSGIKPIPHKSYAEEYIKAFYLPDSASVEDWIGKHPEYSITQVSSLLNSAASKRTRNRLLNVLEGNRD